MIDQDETVTKINHQLTLLQKRDGLTFGTDAYLLAAYVRRQPHARLADLGSGTGIIPLLLLAQKKIASAYAIELQPDFATLIARNAALNGFDEILHPICADVRDLTAQRLGETIDIVVSNPPYMKTSGKANESERKNLARHEIAGGISDFCAAAAKILRHGGLFYTVWRPDRLCALTTALCEAKLEPKRMTFVHARAELPPCLVLCESKKGAAPGIYVTPPLILYSHDKSDTEALSKIYDIGEFDEHYQRP